MTVAPDPDDPTALLLHEAGAAFRLEEPEPLEGGGWPWRTLTRVLLYATALLEQQGPRAASSYLEFTLPKHVDTSSLEPLACEAMAEIANLWGVCYRRLTQYETALELFDSAVSLTRRERIRQHALYNRGFTRLLLVLRGPDYAF